MSERWSRPRSWSASFGCVTVVTRASRLRHILPTTSQPANEGAEISVMFPHQNRRVSYAVSNNTIMVHGSQFGSNVCYRLY